MTRGHSSHGGLDRRTVLKLSAVGASSLIAGCTGGNTDGSQETTTTEAEDGSSKGEVTADRIGTGDQELVYWAIKAHSHQDENEAFANTIRNDFYAEWAGSHPEYSINYQLQPSYNQFQTKLVQAAAQGNAPDISIADSFWVPNFYDELTPVTDRIDDTDDWFPFVKDVVVQDGEWVTVWQNTDCRALYYRQDMIDEYGSGNPPETWEEVVTVGQDIAENENMSGFMFNGGRWEGTTFDNLAHYWGQGGQILDDNRNLVIDTDENRDRLLNVFQFFQQAVDSGATPQRVASITDYDTLTQAAVNGDTAMFVGGNWQIASIKQDVDDWENWQVAKIPMRESDMAATGSGGWTQCVFTGDDGLVEAAKDFTTMWVDKDKMATYAREGGYLPTRPSIFEEYEYFSEDPYQQTFGQLLEDSQARPGGQKYSTFSSEFQVATGKVLSGQASPENAVNTLVESVMSQHGG